MKPLRMFAATSLICLSACTTGQLASAVDTISPPAQASYQPIATDFFGDEMFYDSIHHFQMSMKPDERNYPRYEAHQVGEIAANFMALQNPDGGWPKNADWFKIPSDPSAEGRLRELHPDPGAHSTFDNRNTWSQLIYLMRAYEQISSPAIRRSFERGLSYVLEAQNEVSGGWRGADVDAVTYNDDVMVGVLYFLTLFIDGDHRIKTDMSRDLLEAAENSYGRGFDLIFETQVAGAEGRPLVWGQQHDHKTLKPIMARSFEPAALTALESVNVVRLLMMKQRTPRITAAIEGAVAWFEAAKINGIRVDTIDAEPVQFRYRFSDKDMVAVEDPDAPPIWARFYELGTNRPIFSNRNSDILDDFNDIPRERREGYGWYGYWPKPLLETDYPAWQAGR